MIYWKMPLLAYCALATAVSINSASHAQSAVNSAGNPPASFSADTLSDGTTIPNRPSATALKLTEEQRASIRAAIDTRSDVVDFPLGTTAAATTFTPAVGTSVPSALEGQTLPVALGEKIPALREYVYLKLNGKAVIVDPMTRKVAEIVALP